MPDKLRRLPASKAAVGSLGSNWAIRVRGQHDGSTPESCRIAALQRFDIEGQLQK
jgi:hypothetical protein